MSVRCRAGSRPFSSAGASPALCGAPAPAFCSVAWPPPPGSPRPPTPSRAGLMTCGSLGFGAGMGLPNIKKNSDEFDLESEVGVGTKVIVVIKHQKP